MVPPKWGMWSATSRLERGHSACHRQRHH